MSGMEPSPTAQASNARNADLVFSTCEHPLGQQFDLWCSAIDSITEVSRPADVPSGTGYDANLRAFNLGNLVLSSEQFDAMDYEVRPRELRRNGVDHWMLTLNKQGSAVSRTGDFIMNSRPGELSVRSLTRPFSGHCSRVELLILYVPRDAYPHLAGTIDALNGTSASGGVFSLLADYLLLLEARLPTLDDRAFRQIAQACESMITSCLAPTQDSIEAARAQLAMTMRERAKRYIRSRMRSADLSPDEVGKALGMSRTQLYRLFEQDGGVAREIRMQRLAAAHASLADLGTEKKISEIAYEFGFSSPDEFGRAFRRQYGYSPKDARYLGVHVHSLATVDRQGDFNSLMKNLGRAHRSGQDTGKQSS